MRINRYLSDLGLCSRRKADEWITEGRVSLRGKIAVLGDEVGLGDEVAIDGCPVEVKTKNPVVLAYNKPRGIECTADERVEDNIIRAVNYPERIYNVGRLDKFSEGLILLTNIGELAHQLMHARFGHEKEYIVALENDLAPQELSQLTKGLMLPELPSSRNEKVRPTAPCKIRRLSPRTYEITLNEGRNRQIRRMIEALGNNRVKNLQRVRVGPIELGKIKLGEWRKLTAQEVENLQGDEG